MSAYRDLVAQRGGRFTNRDEARDILTRKIASQAKVRFATTSPAYLIADAEERLRWIDCAPEGANHLVAPLQGDYGVPTATLKSQNVGPSRVMRERVEEVTGRPWQEWAAKGAGR